MRTSVLVILLEHSFRTHVVAVRKTLESAKKAAEEDLRKRFPDIKKVDWMWIREDTRPDRLWCIPIPYNTYRIEYHTIR